MVAPSSGAGDRASAAMVMTSHPYDWITGLEDDELRLTACHPHLPAPETTNLIVYSKKVGWGLCKHSMCRLHTYDKGSFPQEKQVKFQAERTDTRKIKNISRPKCRNSIQVSWTRFFCSTAETTALVNVRLEADNVNGYEAPAPSPRPHTPPPPRCTKLY